MLFRTEIQDTRPDPAPAAAPPAPVENAEVGPGANRNMADVPAAGNAPAANQARVERQQNVGGTAAAAASVSGASETGDSVPGFFMVRGDACHLHRTPSSQTRTDTCYPKVCYLLALYHFPVP